MLPILRLVVGVVLLGVVVVVGVLVVSWLAGNWFPLLLPPSSGSSQDPVLCCAGAWVAAASVALRFCRRGRELATALVVYFSLW